MPQTSVGLSGSRGVVKVGYQEAVTLGAWRATTEGPGEWRIEAAIVARDPFWSDQRPLDLCLEVGRQTWVWRLGRVDWGEAAHVTLVARGRPTRRET